MTNARTIIEAATRKINVSGVGQNLSAEEAQDALEALNSLLSSFSVSGELVYTQTAETYTLTGSQSFTIGTGGDFNTTRPVRIISAFVRNGSTDYPLKLITPAEYANISQKDITGIPEYLYYDQNYPLGTMRVFPVGDASYTLHLYSYKPIASFADLTTDYSLPEGVERMLVYNLAVELAPEYEKEPSPTVRKIAAQSKEDVMGQNKRANYPISDLGLGESGEFNIYSGSYL